MSVCLNNIQTPSHADPFPGRGPRGGGGGAESSGPHPPTQTQQVNGPERCPVLSWAVRRALSTTNREFQASEMIHGLQPDRSVFPLSHGPVKNVSICVNGNSAVGSLLLASQAEWIPLTAHILHDQLLLVYYCFGHLFVEPSPAVIYSVNEGTTHSHIKL